MVSDEDFGKRDEGVVTKIILPPHSPAFDDLIEFFRKVTLTVNNSQGAPIGKVDFAECKTCMALVRQDRPSLYRHIQWHQK